jgi:hypothetical protein
MLPPHLRPFNWSGIVDVIVETFGKRTRFISTTFADAEESSKSQSGGGALVQVIVFDAEYEDVAAHIYFDAETSLLCAELVTRKPVPTSTKDNASNEDNDRDADAGEGDGGGGASGVAVEITEPDNNSDDEDDEEHPQVIAEHRLMANVVNMVCGHLWGHL